MPDAAEKSVTPITAVLGLRPRSVKWTAWCKLTPACTGHTRIVKIASSQNVGVARASERVKVGSGSVTFPGVVPVSGCAASGLSPRSSGRPTINSQVGRNPTASTVAPTATQPARQPPCSIAQNAMSGISVRPAICASIDIESASGRRATNQFTTAPSVPRSKGPAKFIRAMQKSR